MVYAVVIPNNQSTNRMTTTVHSIRFKAPFFLLRQWHASGRSSRQLKWESEIGARNSMQSETGGGRGDHAAALPERLDEVLPLD
jgi:hypothetical protein